MCTVVPQWAARTGTFEQCTVASLEVGRPRVTDTIAGATPNENLNILFAAEFRTTPDKRSPEGCER